MKTKLTAVLTIVVMLFATAISVSAYTPSAENQVDPTLTVITTSVGDYEVKDYDVTIETSADEIDEVSDLIADASDIEDLVGSTGMLTPVVSAVYHIVISDDLQEALDANPDAVLEIIIADVGVDAGVNVLAYVYKNAEFSEVDAVNNGDNSVTVTGTFCPLVLVVDSAVVESPDTSAQVINVFAIVAMLSVFAAAGCYLISRKSTQVA